jgi:multidrug efflux pump subunit AcrB
MGLILLAGIVVKNSILLIDFVETSKQQKGSSTIDALRESVRVRTRPILMTAFGTAVGMLPIALERAIGLERLSPLAVVTIGGLMLSTFLTLLYVPIFYTVFEDGINWLKELIIRLRQMPTKPAAASSVLDDEKSLEISSGK